MASLSNEAKLNLAGLVLTAIGMVLQIGAGSELFPSPTGPIVLLATAVVVGFRSSRWTGYVGLIVPLVLGVGLAISAAVSPVFLEQLTDFSNPGIVLGSVLHVVGLIAAVVGGLGLVFRRPGENSSTGLDDHEVNAR